MSPTVVILGGGTAGIFTAHKLLKYTTPKLKGLKVILVSASTHFFWNVASLRGVIPGEIPDEGLFHPIAPGFAKFGKEEFEFVVGIAKTLEPETNTVQVELTGGAGRAIQYDHLVVATGSSISADDMPFKNLDNHQKTVEALHRLQESIDAPATKSIVIAGAGPTGVELAGELGQRYGKAKEKTITLIADGDRVLLGNLDGVSKVAESHLAKLGVQLIHNAKVNEARDGHAYLSTGKVIPADVYMPVFGVRANTSFVPAKYLDDARNLKLDTTLKVEGLKNVWGVGDVGNVESKQLYAVESQVTHLAGNLDSVLCGKASALKVYTPGRKVMIFVTVGKAAGTGQFGDWKVPSFVVSMMKSKSLMTNKPPSLVAGKSMIMGSV